MLKSLFFFKKKKTSFEIKIEEVYNYCTLLWSVIIIYTET